MLVGIRFGIFDLSRHGKNKRGNRFQNLDSRCDRWIPLYSPRIAKLHSCSWQDGVTDPFQLKMLIDDSSDSKIRGNEDQVFAVFRPTLGTSKLLIDCLNLFGFEGGYDKILDLLYNANPISFSLFEDLIYLIGTPF